MVARQYYWELLDQAQYPRHLYEVEPLTFVHAVSHVQSSMKSHFHLMFLSSQLCVSGAAALLAAARNPSKSIVFQITQLYSRLSDLLVSVEDLYVRRGLIRSSQHLDPARLRPHLLLAVAHVSCGNGRAFPFL